MAKINLGNTYKLGTTLYRDTAGVLEKSTDNGTAWNAVSGSFLGSKQLSTTALNPGLSQDKYVYQYDHTSGKVEVVSMAELQKTLILESPVAIDDILIMELSKAITIRKVTHQVFGTTSVTFNINHSGGTDLWASDKVCTTTKVAEASFTDNTCTAAQIRYQASAISGTPTRIEITITYTED